MDRVYLDYAATTPVDDRVINAINPYFNSVFGNPSSTHFFGQKAEAAIENAREDVAGCFGVKPQEIIFTACGTESDNLALRGVAFARRNKNRAKHMLISPVEHHAVIHTARQLADEFDFELEMLPVDEYGMIKPDDVEARIRQETAFVSVIYANNEIGTINPIAEIGAVCRSMGVPFHTDAVQAAAHLHIEPDKDQIDLMAIGAHKFYGPKGVGALYVRKGIELTPIITGGSQESGLRAGTQNVPYIVGLAEALKITQQEMDGRSRNLIEMRDALIRQVLNLIPGAKLTGHPTRRLPNHASFVFKGVDGNQLLMNLDARGFACSSGSACKSGSPKPSDVLLAIGLSRDWALGSLRVTLGKNSTMDEVEKFVITLPEAIKNAQK
jgi:cysteine desulfurase